MSTSKTLHGTVHLVPETNETDWGSDVSNLLIATIDYLNASHQRVNPDGFELYEATANGTNKLLLRAPAVLAGDVTWTLPAADAAGFFKSDGAGAVSLASGTSTLDSAYDNGHAVTVDAGAITLDRATGGEVLTLQSSTSGNPFMGLSAGTSRLIIETCHDSVAHIGTTSNHNVELWANNAKRFEVKTNGDAEATGDVKGATVTSTGVVTAGSVSSTGAVGCTDVNASGNVGCVDVNATGDVGGATGTFTGDITAGGGFRQLINGWWHDNVGSGGDLNYAVMEFGSGAGNWRIYMPRAGSVTAVGFHTTETCSGGNAGIKVYKNGVALTPYLSISTGDGIICKSTTYTKDTYTFTAGDYLDIRIASNAFTPTTADWRAFIEIEE